MVGKQPSFDGLLLAVWKDLDWTPQLEYDNASGILCSESSEERHLETFGSPLFTTVALCSLKQEEWEERWKTYDQDSQDQRESRCSLPSGIC